MNAIHNIALRFFLTASTEEALEAFGTLPHAVRGEGFVYVPGKREYLKRLLLVGHADTVRVKDLSMRCLRCKGGTFSATDGPLGADDRAGLAMLWILAGENREHSLLVTDGEESGGIGAKEATDAISGELLQHAFCVEVDRKGCEEMVFYDGTSNAVFKAWLKEVFPKWTQDTGSYTDIATICNAALVCGVNLAAGYRGQHTQSETLTYADWLKTLKALQPVLELAEYPEFGVPDEKEERKIFALKAGYGYPWEWSDAEGDYGKEWWRKKADAADATDDAEDGDDNSALYERERHKGSGKLALLKVDEEDGELMLPVLNAAGDVVDYVSAAAVSEEARIEGFVEQSDLEETA